MIIVDFFLSTDNLPPSDSSGGSGHFSYSLTPTPLLTTPGSLDNLTTLSHNLTDNASMYYDYYGDVPDPCQHFVPYEDLTQLPAVMPILAIIYIAIIFLGICGNALVIITGRSDFLLKIYNTLHQI